MHRFTILLLALLAALSFATDYGVQRTDKFEDLGDGDVAGNPPEVNSDGGIIYNRFGLTGGAVQGVPRVSGIRPVSGIHQILSQRPARGSVATTGRCLKLKQLFVGCVGANAQGVLTKPLACTLTFTSFDGNGDKNGQQQAKFTPSDLLLSDPLKVVFTLPPARVVQISATVLEAGGVFGTLAAGMYLDDVTYTQYDNSAGGVKACGKGF